MTFAYWTNSLTNLVSSMWFRLHQSGAFFVTRAEKKTQYRRQYLSPVDRGAGLRADQTIRLTGETTQHTHPTALLRW
jgi:hypothetical protein